MEHKVTLKMNSWRELSPGIHQLAVFRTVSRKVSSDFPEQDSNFTSISLECGLPPEYCAFGQKDTSACVQWLQANHPALYREIYGDAALVPTETSGEAQQDGGADGDDKKIEQDEPNTNMNDP